MSINDNPIDDGIGNTPDTGEIMEHIEPAEFTEQDQADLAKLVDEKQAEAEYHSLLEVWNSLLDSAHHPTNKHMTPKWAMAIIGQYVGISFADLERYVDQYFELLDVLHYELEKVIEVGQSAESGIDCLDVSSAEEDILVNSGRFRELLREWQLRLLERELGWESGHPDAALHIAALSEIQKLFFGSNGLTGHLEAIKFEFSDEDAAELQAALEERRDELMGAK